MKKNIFLLIFFSLIIPGSAFAVSHDIHLSWEFTSATPPEGTTLAGYKLYKEGTEVCNSDDPDDREMNCLFESETGTFSFTLTTLYSNNTESPHSSPYIFVLTNQTESNLIADFTTVPQNLSGETPFEISFNASQSTESITSYSWDFGDNSTASGSQATHVYTNSGTFTATLTISGTDGTTSQQTAIITTTAPQSSPVAVISPATFSGEAPLTVLFNGTPSSNTTTYQWIFGDGATSNSSQVNHIFTSAGTYTTTLTTSNAQGETDSANVQVTVSEPSPEKTPPTAVISTSTTMGEAPLNVNFNGTGSSDAEGSIVSYSWSFGDGSQSATGSTTNHIYTDVGTFNATLTVTDSAGATDSKSTPVIITGQSDENLAPTANFTTSVDEGAIPLIVEFNASASSDPENGSLTYSWNFGDGTSSQGVQTSHTFTTAGTFTVNLQVTDDQGAPNTATKMITALANTEEPIFTIELGEVEIDNNWGHVSLDEQFTNPIVVTGSPSSKDSDPCVIRLRNVTASGFDIRIQEWDYLDGTHQKETVPYFVMEQGSFTLEDGVKIEAGTFLSLDSTPQIVNFNAAFPTVPVVMSTIASYNEADAATGRLYDINTNSFSHLLQEQESSNSAHTPERINYIACEPFHSVINDLRVIVAKTGDKIQHRWRTIQFGEQLNEPPIFLATMQTLDENDPSTIRFSNRTTNGIQIKVEEEKSKNAETRHTTENVGYLLFSSNIAGTLPEAVINYTRNGTTYSFDGSSSSDENSEIVEYQWDFGDEQTETGDIVAHQFETEGTYQVTLTVTNDKGANNSTETTITFTNDTCQDCISYWAGDDFTLNTAGGNPGIIEKNASITNNDGGYEGKGLDCSGTNMYATFSAAGNINTSTGSIELMVKLSKNQSEYETAVFFDGIGGNLYATMNADHILFRYEHRYLMADNQTDYSALQADTWYKLKFSWSSSDISISLDDVEIQSASHEETPPIINSLRFSGTWSASIFGVIDEIKIK